ncbi:MAG: hypothetical protein ABSG07_18675 [Terriglobales bacterium]|jgi:hypothetical protein
MSIDRFYKFEDGKRVDIPRNANSVNSAGDFQVVIHHGGEITFPNSTDKGFHTVDDCYCFPTLKEARAFCEGGWREYQFKGEDADYMRASIYVNDHSSRYGTVLANYEDSKLIAGLEMTVVESEIL